MDAVTNRSMDFGAFVEEMTKVAHEVIDRMHTRAMSMEDGLGERARAGVEGLAGRMEHRMDRFGEYMEKNPLAATMIAFGVGYFASRAFGIKEPTPLVGTKRAKGKKVIHSIGKKAA